MLPVTMLAISALLALASSLAAADHYDCHWQPTGGAVPGNDGWLKLCDAYPVGSNGNEFHCPGPSGRPGSVVAVYTDAIEVGTPCGGGGYGFGHRGHCYSDSWLACAHFASASNCYGLDKSDDCKWPPSPKPDYMTVYWRA